MTAHAPYEHNYYLVLNVPADADAEEIKGAYRKLSKLCHPDLGGQADAQARLNEAYDTLSKPLARKDHDRYWRSRTPPFFRGADQEIRAKAEDRRPRDGPFPSGAQSRVDIKENFKVAFKKLRADTQSDYEQKRPRFLAYFLRARKEMLGRVILCGLALPLSIVLSFLAGNVLPLSIAGVFIYFAFPFRKRDFEGFSYSLMDLRSHELEALVNGFMRFKISGEIRVKENLWNGVEDLLNPRSFTFVPSSSERNMALLLALGFFCEGYKPLELLAAERILVFEGDVGIILVRYRHRGGSPTNVDYVRDFAAQQDGVKALYGKGLERSYFFSSPGFSRNARAECEKQGVHCYDLEEFQDWLAELRRVAFLGPRDDLFQSLERLHGIVSQLR